MSEQAEVLRKAKKHIEDNGWHGNGPGNHSVRFDSACISNSIQRVDMKWIGREDSLFGMELAEIWHWNDAPDRTIDDIYAKFDARIAFWEAQS